MSEPLDWQRLEDLFDQVSDIPRDERIGWIDRLEGENPDVVLRLRRMVAAHEGSGPLDKLISVPARDDILARLGSALEGRYTIEGLLGRGGMATVVRARELKHDRLVVIKVLDPGMAAAIGHHRFVDEVRIAAQLSHPHILALIDSGEVDGLRYYVMPYVGGETLRQRLSRDGALPMATALSLLRSIADALSHAHAAGVVHRDLKPENVLCVGEHPFLLDFGIAKVSTLERGESERPITKMGAVFGTPEYMAPEQAAGQAVDGSKFRHGGQDPGTSPAQGGPTG